MSHQQLIRPVILSGGGGTRLWPLSTPPMPKQFLALTGDVSLYAQTLLRVSPDAGTDAGLAFAPPLIVGSAAHGDLLAQQASAAGVAGFTLVMEPLARNTAAAVAFAAHLAAPDDLLLVLPSDHLIADVGAFHAAVAAGVPHAAAGWLVTFGIAPTGPETGYGYIARGAPLSPACHRVERFIEKPERAVAEAMLEAGGHDWNGGIFLFRAASYLEQLALHATDIARCAAAAMEAAVHGDGAITPDAASLAACPSVSIDYAVMEKAADVAVVPVAMGWSDVGSWDAIYETGAQDESGNVVRGDHLAIDARGNLVMSDALRVSLMGVDNLIIVEHGGELLIMPRGTSQNVRRVVAAKSAPVPAAPRLPGSGGNAAEND